MSPPLIKPFLLASCFLPSSFLMIEMMSTEPRQKDSERADLASPFFDSHVAETVRVVLPSRSLRPRPSLIRVSVMASSNLSGSISVRAPRGSFAPSSRRGRPLPVLGSSRTRAYELAGKAERSRKQSPSKHRLRIEQFTSTSLIFTQIKQDRSNPFHVLHVIRYTLSTTAGPL